MGVLKLEALKPSGSSEIHLAVPAGLKSVSNSKLTNRQSLIEDNTVCQVIAYGQRIGHSVLQGL